MEAIAIECREKRQNRICKPGQHGTAPFSVDYNADILDRCRQQYMQFGLKPINAPRKAPKPSYWHDKFLDAY